MSRKYLGRASTLVSRETVYETDDALEVQSTDQYEVSEKRVLFADVTMITLHRERGMVFLILMTGLSTLMLFPAVLGLTLGSTAVAVTFAIIASPFVVATLLRAILGVDVVTVSGRRTRTALRFAFRKRRAREVYEHLCATVAATQQRLAEQYEAEAAAGPRAPSPELPEEEVRPVLSNPFGGGLP